MTIKEDDKMHTNNEVLLMTATIHTKNTPHVKIRNDEERLFQYLCSLTAWIKLTNINTIVFCENSNTSFNFQKVIEFARMQGKTIEVLIFNGNQGSQKYGKGHGEGMIIKHAINNSENLDQDVSFYKITGRIFVKNFDVIQRAHAEFSTVFKMPAWSNEHVSSNIIASVSAFDRLKATVRFWQKHMVFIKARGLKGPHDQNNNVYTVFYKSNVRFFKKHLLNSYKRVNDDWGYCLECAYYDDLLKKDSNPLLIDCELVGRSGTSGKLLAGLDYTDDIKGIARTFM
jgi:hypothetical protein